MRPYFLSAGNAESRHSAGRRARRAWDEARETTARVVGAFADEVVFTSGGTEANNLAVLGLAREEDEDGDGPGAIVSSPIEHPAVAEPIARLEARGFAVDRPEVDALGLVDADAAASLINDRTRLATLMLANNETGAVQPVARLAELAAARGAPVHTDAVQAVGRVAVDFHALGVSTLAASAHKFHGPVGVGLLLIKRGVKLAPRLFGGGQQQGRRPGTAPVPLVVGLATALDVWRAESEARRAAWSRLSDRLEAGLVAALGRDRVIRNGPLDPSLRLPQTVNVGFVGVEGEALMIQLDLAGVAVSLGSACASGSTQPSPTLVAMRVPADRLRSSVRFSLGAFTTESEIDEAVARTTAAVKRLTF
jgi:cysteine desulfurase